MYKIKKEIQVMKKEYMSPEICVQEVKIQNILAGSVDLNPKDEITDPNEVGSDEGGFLWDDED